MIFETGQLRIALATKKFVMNITELYEYLLRIASWSYGIFRDNRW